ncbi:COX15-CtaA-domain-containing protein [Thelephora ganbajun]|uniref:COX15-CtaA-domain-containing protein n=1 Tax=Thelephora ganbajun TaxID=370292 RepID=A0ACB6ZNW1_THEGA|nr:COX15-CtaA-domain-containing protein [Thelephora ganbajun]
MLGSPLQWKAIAKELSSVVSSQPRAFNRSTSLLGVGFKCQSNGLANTRSAWNYSALSHPQAPTSSTVNAAARKSTRFDPRFFSSNANPTQGAGQLPVLSSPGVGGWLMGSAGLVFAVIVVGGVTRLTESGLSITEWKPISGTIPPLSQEEWMVEFEKYKATPEFKLLNHSMNLEEFKKIFYMEWGHRVLGRIIGVAFVLPLVYFAARKKLTATLPKHLTAMALLLGFQGALGWYMVKSGLEDSLMDSPNAVPRVSQYRLAAHLGTAFLLYAGMFGTGLSVLYDWRFAKKGTWSGMTNGAAYEKVLANPLVKTFSRRSKALTALVFVTALSGAFVAGLDAGLLYNEFPLMGGRLSPPTDELFDPAYAKKEDKSDLWWRNILENPTTVQFNHRCLAITTYVSTGLLFVSSRNPRMKAALTPMANRMVKSAFLMANVQVALGISTLLYLVPIPLAALHQAGSVALLTTMIHLLISLRRPGAAARLWRQANLAKTAGNTHA